MRKPTSRPSAAELHEQQAATWIIRQDRGLTATEQDEFLQWLASDARHAAALARHRRNWERLDLLGQWRPEHSPRPNRDLLAPPRAKVFRFPRFWLTGLALAAAAAIVGLVVWPRISAPTPKAVASGVTAIEEQTLSDGSVIQLNRGGAVTVNYTPAERRVQLVRGEAHFTVAKNHEWPFIVSAGGVDVRAVGTAFDVRLGQQAVEVLVTEGKVRVYRKNEAVAGGRATVVPELSLGQRVVVPLAAAGGRAAVAAVPPEQAAEVLAWQPRMLTFTATPLRGIVTEFNRCNAPVHLVIADADLAEIEMSAAMRSDNVEGFIRLLEASFEVRVERSGHTITLHRR